MLAKKSLLAMAVMALALPAFAAPIVLNFEDVPAEPSRVGKSYEVTKGVTFSDNAWSAISFDFKEESNDYGRFFRAADTTRGALSLSSRGLTNPGMSGGFYVNVAAGFTSAFSMLYTSALDAGTSGSVQLWSGEDGKGELIQTRGDSTGLGAQPVCRDPNGTAIGGLLCTWDSIDVTFDGTAKSVYISGLFGKYWFDNLVLGEVNAGPGPGTDVPEPGGVALSLAALGALAWTRKRVAQR